MLGGYIGHFYTCTVRLYTHFYLEIHVIIIKTKVLIPQICLGPLVFLPPKTFKLFGFEIFWLRPEGYSRNLISTILLYIYFRKRKYPLATN